MCREGWPSEGPAQTGGEPVVLCSPVSSQLLLPPLRSPTFLRHLAFMTPPHFQWPSHDILSAGGGGPNGPTLLSGGPWVCLFLRWGSVLAICKPPGRKPHPKRSICPHYSIQLLVHSHCCTVFHFVTITQSTHPFYCWQTCGFLQVQATMNKDAISTLVLIFQGAHVCISGAIYLRVKLLGLECAYVQF